jgi:hypothetical protein
MGYEVDICVNNISSYELNEFKKTLNSYDIKYLSEDIEYDNNPKEKKLYRLLEIYFESSNYYHLIELASIIKKKKGVFIMQIFNDETNKTIYSCRYYDKYLKHKSQNDKSSNKSRRYSDSDILILQKMKII